MSEKGLHGKYEVYHDGEPQPDTFVLKPETDEAARTALKSYALATDNPKLKEELLAWVDEIEEVPKNAG